MHWPWSLQEKVRIVIYNTRDNIKTTQGEMGPVALAGEECEKKNLQKEYLVMNYDEFLNVT